ncbi:uncharacterized protein LOC111062186 [Nilaparvata lugens]|uniref:uncharacterized protein LOC111062186 n=1 Tax=Nilaparvata lugens TaxID=108931 RepID=UPI00193EA8A1|nr:uncharacterized protein LOC111062186 [Nilaparvata lugens]
MNIGKSRNNEDVEMRRRIGDVNYLEERTGDEGSGNQKQRKEREEEVCDEEMQVAEEENKERAEESVIIRSNNRENMKSLPDYVSPLNYMQKSNVSNVRDDSKKLIYCPYDLMGSCLDETCPYLHSARKSAQGQLKGGPRSSST